MGKNLAMEDNNFQTVIDIKDNILMISFTAKVFILIIKGVINGKMGLYIKDNFIIIKCMELVCGFRITEINIMEILQEIIKKVMESIHIKMVMYIRGNFQKVLLKILKAKSLFEIDNLKIKK